tara:strand:+ start:375 stop:548 length:174 start_codon:yes stop_codon:yes gene_type:complete
MYENIDGAYSEDETSSCDGVIKNIKSNININVLDLLSILISNKEKANEAIMYTIQNI